MNQPRHSETLEAVRALKSLDFCAGDIEWWATQLIEQFSANNRSPNEAVQKGEP